MIQDLVKICGLANQEDVTATLSLEPDAVGFILWPKSPRGVSAKDVAVWTQDQMPPRTRKVGVFVDSSVEQIEAMAEEAGLDILQLHGAYTAEQILQLSKPVWRVLHVDRLPDDWNEVPVEALLVDSGTVEMPGGTGVRVDIDAAVRLIEESNYPVVLAGGLKAGTVHQAIRDAKPDGVDVSSGVELHPGKKDMQAVQEFVHQARNAYTQL